ncbi:hypothetical protein R1flu_025899 [Riccia fluitans]|uniref:Uncharacterized protein n=1 Tax=Riccia fluitans TaxID=41844 RepID=A0ABD1XZ23_9MARC
MGWIKQESDRIRAAEVESVIDLCPDYTIFQTFVGCSIAKPGMLLGYPVNFRPYVTVRENCQDKLTCREESAGVRPQDAVVHAGEYLGAKFDSGNLPNRLLVEKKG